MKFRIVFWDVLPCKIIADNYFTRQYIPEDNSELQINMTALWDMAPCSLVEVDDVSEVLITSIIRAISDSSPVKEV
jgi:hypothetical protein